MSYRSQNPSPIATWLLIAINLVLYLVRVINPGFAYELTLDPTSFWDRPWTLVSSMFIHVDLWHIFANMVALYFFGSFLNRLLGTTKFLIVYFAGGIAGGILYLLLSFSGSPAAGASGAIFALGGVLAVMRPRLRVRVFPIPDPIPLWIAIIGIFTIFSILSVSTNVAWQAHAGGLALGLVAGYVFRRRERYRYY